MLCGMRVRSALALPELDVAPADGAVPDVVVAWGDVPERLADICVDQPLLQMARDGTLRFEMAGVGAFLVSPDARQVTIAAAMPADAAIRSLFYAPILSILCIRRGLLALHAAAVEVNGRAVVFLGEAGAGKSVLAARLGGMGHRLLSDDIGVIDFSGTQGPHVRPGVPRIDLWRDVPDIAGFDPDTLEPVGRGIEKYCLSPPGGHCAEPLPLAAILHLEHGGYTMPGLRHLPTMEGMRRIAGMLHRTRLANDIGQRDGQMAMVMRAVAAVGGVRALARPETAADWDELAAMLPELAEEGR